MLADVFTWRGKPADFAVRFEALPLVKRDGGCIGVRDIQKQSPYAARSRPRNDSVDQSRSDTGLSYIRCDPHRQHPCRLGLRFVPRASHHTDIYTAVDSNKCRHLLELCRPRFHRPGCSLFECAAKCIWRFQQCAQADRPKPGSFLWGKSVEVEGNTHASVTGAARGTPALPAGDTLRYAQPFPPAVAHIRLSRAVGCHEGRVVAPAFQRQVRTARASA